MKVNYTLLSLVSALFILASCSDKPFFEQRQNKTNFVWNRFDTLTFNTPDFEKGLTADIEVDVIYTSDMPINMLPIRMVVLAPDGSERTIDKKIWLRNHDGTINGKQQNNGWIHTSKVVRGFVFNQGGVNKITIENTQSKYDLQGIAGVVLRITKPTSKASNPIAE